MLKIEGNALHHFFAGQTLYIPKPEKKQATTAFDYEGENNKYILLLFSHTGNEGVPKAQRFFLEKILEATKLSFADVAMLNLNNYPDTDFETLKNYFSPSAVFLWGINPAVFDIKAPLYQPVLHNKAKVIYVDAIDAIEKDKALKGKLWGILQTHFLK